MEFKVLNTNHLVKSEDLNHHGTLYAGRSTEWFVEAGFITVAHSLPPASIVCLQIHGIEFLHPVKAGHIITYNSQIVRTGRSTVTVYVETRDCHDTDILVSRGFITFCHVNQDTLSEPHGLTFTPVTEREKELNQKAIELNKR